MKDHHKPEKTRMELENRLRRFRIRRLPEIFMSSLALLGISAADSRLRSRPQTASTWSWRRDLNPRPPDYKSGALPTELRQRHPSYNTIPGLAASDQKK